MHCGGEGHFYSTCPEIGKALSVPFTSPRFDATSTGQGGGVAVSTMESWKDTKISRDAAVERVQIWNVEVAGKTASQFSMIESVVTAAEVAAQETNGRKKKRGNSKSKDKKDVFEDWLVEGQIKTTKVSGGMIAMLACATGVFSSTLKIGARCGFCIKLRGSTNGWFVDDNYSGHQPWHNLDCAGVASVKARHQIVKLISNSFVEKRVAGSKVIDLTANDVAEQLVGKGVQFLDRSMKNPTEMKRVYRAREAYEQIVDGHTIEQGFGCLKDLFDEYCQKNPGAVQDIGYTVSENGQKHFKRAFLMDPILANAMMQSLIRITTVDAGHISHKLYDSVAV